MARPKRQQDAPQTRDQILKAARIEFAAQGINAPLADIAARCHIKRPSLLHHFASKQALIAAVTDDIVNKARERLLKTISERSDDQIATIQQVFNVLRELEREEQGIGSVLMHAMMAEETDGPVTQKMAEFIDIICSTVLQAGREQAGDPEEFRAVIAHLVMGEATRVALGNQSHALWGKGDGLNALFSSYFLNKNTESN